MSVQLSGGLESTAVSCLAADGLRDRSTLVLVTTSSVSPGNDDLVWACHVGEHLAPAEHVVLDAQDLPRFFDDLPTTASGMDEPAPFTAASARLLGANGALSLAQAAGDVAGPVGAVLSVPGAGGGVGDAEQVGEHLPVDRAD